MKSSTLDHKEFFRCQELKLKICRKIFELNNVTTERSSGSPAAVVQDTVNTSVYIFALVSFLLLHCLHSVQAE